MRSIVEIQLRLELATINVLVYLGNINLKTFYFYKEIELVSIMLLSFRGKLLS